METPAICRLEAIRMAFAALFFCCLSAVSAGDLTARYELTLSRVLKGGPPVYTDEFVLADAVPQHVRRFTEFSGDVSGRYIGALAVASECSGRKFADLDRIVAKVVKLQKADGHFGDPFSTNGVTQSDMALLWGNGRLLIGLLEYHRLKPTPEVLACARQLGDCFVKLGPRINTDAIRKQYSANQIAVGYICWTQITESLVELHRATHDARYLTLAEQIAANTHCHPNQHSHGFVTALRGILELYRTTRDEKWLTKVETEWEGILSSGNLFPQGALPEVFKPMTDYTEGCSEADWLRLNLALWTETRNARYIENAELTLFNEFFLNQFHTGDFGHHKLTSNGIGAFCARGWWCCTFHGLRAFPDVFRSAFHAETNGLRYDLPVDGQGVIDGLAIRADSTLEQNATVTLTVEKSDGKEHTLRIRQPVWATVDPREIRRVWRTGETVTIRYALATRQIAHPQNPKLVAFLRGPWFLGVNEQDAPTFFDEPCRDNLIAPPAPLAGEKTTAGPFRVPAGYLSLDYLPGGYRIQPQTVTLRPIAEHTALADGTQWAMWFLPKPEK